MSKKRLSTPKEDWLAGNAMAAFAGALLMVQSLKLPEGGTEISFYITKLTIPAFPEQAYMALGILLLVLSFALAIASMVPPLRDPAIRYSRLFSLATPVLALGAFTVGWLDAVVELASDQWWFVVVFYGGYAFFLFVGYRFVRGSLSSPPPTDNGAGGTGGE